MPENENKVTNPELIEAIAEMRKDFNQQTQSNVINRALRASFLVPAEITQNTQLVQDKENHLKFQDKPQAKFLLINNKKNGGTYFPVFTDEEEYAKLNAEGNHKPITMKFGDIATLTEQTSNVAGFVINPMSHNLPFSKAMLDSIKQTLMKAREARQAAAAAEQAAAASEGGITVSSSEE